MTFRVPHISRIHALWPPARPPRVVLTSLVWGLSVGAVASMALALSIVERIASGSKLERDDWPADSAQTYPVGSGQQTSV